MFLKFSEMIFSYHQSKSYTQIDVENILKILVLIQYADSKIEENEISEIELIADKLTWNHDTTRTQFINNISSSITDVLANEKN